MPAAQALDPNAVYMDAMGRLLWPAVPALTALSCAARLDREQLDFRLESLDEVDRYLNLVHDSGSQAAGRMRLATLWAMALYTGEVIRREAPAGHYAWITVGDTLPQADGPGTPPINVVRALRALDGELCLPSRAVLRVVLRGRKARSIASFARSAIGGSDEPEGLTAPRLRSAMAEISA